MNRQRPLDYEVFKVTKVLGQESDSSDNTVFRPLFETVNQDDGNYGKYFSVNREMRLVSDSIRKYGTRTEYIGSEVFISLVDQFEAPFSDEIRYLSVTAEVTNRDLALLLPRNGKNDLQCKLSIPSKQIGIIRPISPTRAPFALRERAWRLIRQLSFNYLPLSELDGREGGQALRDLLSLFIAHQDEHSKRQIDALLGSDIQPINRRLPGKGPIVYGRGIECEIHVDELGFSGNSPFLFGLILEHFVAKHVSVNMFTQTRLSSLQRGHIHRFAPRMGRRTSI
jgi:type VI secretion system protein ImpG